MQSLSRCMVKHRIASFAGCGWWRRRWCQHVSHCSHSHLGGRIWRPQMMQCIVMIVMRHRWCRW
ncbi:hypothetical protein M5D96_003195 [Drosophila gunungcola]|uniref:Uncharacterized protein n=1 Tax=Drosophila gunungcola TaxID=103775 RepID=A0A9Q0BS53_9MUSC|nr:hypothetical protein M5D96_003195 [Drosophila gunungcola]